MKNGLGRYCFTYLHKEYEEEELMLMRDMLTCCFCIYLVMLLSSFFSSTRNSEEVYVLKKFESSNCPKISAGRGKWSRVTMIAEYLIIP